MTHLTLFICAAIGLLLGLVLWIVFSARLRLTTAEDALEWAQTDDGWALSLHRYLPPGVARAYPVILCHGLGANRFNLDFDAEYSLARFLRARGFEVFVLELRGCGRSHWTGGGRPPAWNFDDFVHHDLPAAIARVRELSGAAQVDWVGHSQGGMVMYAALSGAVGPAVHAFVAIGSPAAFGDHHWLKPLARFHSMARLAPASATPRFVRLVAPLSGHFVVPGLAMLANQSNMRGPVTRRALYNVVGAVAPSVLAQFASFVSAGVLVGADGNRDYDTGYARITTPTLLIAGAADWLGPEYAMRYFLDRIASERKALVVAGRATGFSADYGHGDLVLGRNAPKEIFPLVAEFLERST